MSPTRFLTALSAAAVMSISAQAQTLIQTENVERFCTRSLAGPEIATLYIRSIDFDVGMSRMEDPLAREYAKSHNSLDERGKWKTARLVTYAALARHQRIQDIDPLLQFVAAVCNSNSDTTVHATIGENLNWLNAVANLYDTAGRLPDQLK
jgi:hypothetical protein